MWKNGRLPLGRGSEKKWERLIPFVKSVLAVIKYVSKGIIHHVFNYGAYVAGSRCKSRRGADRAETWPPLLVCVCVRVYFVTLERHLGVVIDSVFESREGCESIGREVWWMCLEGVRETEIVWDHFADNKQTFLFNSQTDPRNVYCVEGRSFPHISCVCVINKKSIFSAVTLIRNGYTKSSY